MSDIESDQESVESGSCTCSDYNPDYSWFYDSRKLETSYMRFCIINDDDQIIFKKNERTRVNLDENKIKKYNKTNEPKNEPKNEPIINPTNKRKNVIKISKSSKRNEPINIINNNRRKANNININVQNRQKIEGLDVSGNDNDDKYKNKSMSYKQKKIPSKNNSSSMLNEINTNTKLNNFFHDNFEDYEHNYSAVLVKNNFDDNNINLHRSPISFTNKTMNIFSHNKTEKKIINLNIPKGHVSPRLNIYDTFASGNYISDEEKSGRNNNNDNLDNIIKKNFQTRGRIIKEKVIKEIKNITLQPGQTIKPRTVTKRKLKPNTTIIKNDDGTQNIITENTILTTITVNEIVDSSKMYHDEYPLDVQLVKQYITKIYKTEIENNPYRQKK